MTDRNDDPRKIVVAGGGIGGLAAALALANKGFPVTVLEQAREFGEIGAGIQLGPNAFHALDRLGVGGETRANAVFIDQLIMMDMMTEQRILSIPVDEPFRKRFGNPYAVIHRADIHTALLDGCRKSPLITLLTKSRVVAYETIVGGVEIVCSDGSKHVAAALIGADGGRSKVREGVVGDGSPVMSGHVAYRAVLPIEEMPEDLRWNAATLWAGPNTHLVHYPLRGWKLFNIVATFHGENNGNAVQGEAGDREELMFRFRHLPPKPRQILERGASWKRWVLGDREPVTIWSNGPVTLLGDAAHPMHQYFAQGACMALEDAVCLGDQVAAADGDFPVAFKAYQDARIVRTGRVVLGARLMGSKVYHPAGVEAQVRNQMLGSKSPEQFYDMLDWLYGGPPEYRKTA